MLYEQLVALSSNADISDYHIKEGEPLRWRLNGALVQEPRTPAVTRDQIVSLLQRNESHSGVQSAKIAEALGPTGDVDLTLKVGSRRYRANLYYSNSKRLGLVLRRYPDTIPELTSLGLPPGYLQMLKNSKGLILVTGATGSGKSTTLAATIEHLNSTVSGHIITIEDPVEFLFKGRKCTVDQRQVGRDVSSFEAGLHAALRQDPDILLVGELRDLETVKTALDAANTGHLVFGTLHTNSALQTLDRLTSFFPAERQAWVLAMLSQVLLGVASQALVPRANGQGRLLAAELMLVTSEIRQHIRQGAVHQVLNAMDTGQASGQVLLNRQLATLVKRNQISEDSALAVAYDIPALKKELSRVR